MTDNRDITPELALRVLAHLEHSKYIGPDGGLNALFTVKDAVENWATDVGSNDLAARLAASMLMAHEGHAHAYENAMGRWREAWDGHAKVALEFLASIGRLIPAGGMALTAEQVEDVRRLVNSDELKGSNDVVRRLRALFPAIEPAECEFRCEEGIVRAEVGVRCPACTAAIRASDEVSGNIVAECNSSPKVVHVHHHDIEAHAASFNEGYDEAMRQLTEPVDTIRNFPRCGHYLDEARCTRRIHDGDHEVVQGDEVIVWPAGEPDPEPAEEEAEAVTRCPNCFGLNGSHNTIHERYPAGGGGTNKPCPNSSPVVSAPTETGWPSLLAVPKSVVAVKDRNGDEWNRGTNGEFCMRVGCGNGHPDFAPFVAVEEQDA